MLSKHVASIYNPTYKVWNAHFSILTDTKHYLAFNIFQSDGEKWCFTVFIYAALIISKVTHIFLCLLAKCIYSSVNCVFMAFIHFSIYAFALLPIDL